MKRFLAAFCLLLASYAPALAFNGGAWAGATFYIDSASGNDSNDGLTPTTAWQTTTKLNAQTFAANTRVFLNGTFNVGIVLTTTVAPASITLAASGGAPVTITSGNAADCVKSTNIAGVILRGIICTGGGNLTNTTAGLNFINSQSGDTKLAGPEVSSVSISGYGYNGFSLEGAAGSSGYSGTRVRNVAIDSVTGNSGDAFGTSCFMVFSKTGYGLGATAPAHVNGEATGLRLSNCTGSALSVSNWGGSGGFVSQAKNWRIAYSTVDTFGSLSAGAFESAGLWSADADAVILEHSVISRGQTGPGGGHADCGGLDGGAVNSYFQYNKCIDNAGFGASLISYNDGTCCAQWGNNHIRFNLFQNNNRDQPTTVQEITILSHANWTGRGYVYGNTIVNSVGSSCFGTVSSSGNAYDAVFANNNCLINNSGKLVQFTNIQTVALTGNNYWTYGTAATFNWNGVNYSNASVATAFAAWQTATNQEKISGSNVGLTVDPLIYVPGGLFNTASVEPAKDMANNLQSTSTLGSAGLNLTTVYGIDPGTTDYYGTAVTAATLPVGAAKADFATFAESCSPAVNLLARVSSFTKLDNVNANSLFCGMNADTPAGSAVSDLSITDALYPLSAPNSAAALLNWKSTSFPITVSGSPTFTARQGYTGNGTAFLNTTYQPSTAGGAMTLNLGSFQLYIQNSRAVTGIIGEIGATNNTTTELSMFMDTGTAYMDLNDFTGLAGPAISDVQGLWGMGRLNNGLFKSRNGASILTTTVAPVALVPQPIYLLAVNIAGTACGSGGCTISSDKISFATLGGYQTGYDVRVPLRINSWHMAYGINVY